mmetsp:Transcript_14827/g.41300  ORF Transcript_14827/g.41300 Transcript_14827/m.41300 type:complete len:88 (-) Transcript_14827:35-298(-)
MPCLRTELSNDVEDNNRSNKGKACNQNGGRSNLQTGRIVCVELKNVVPSSCRSASTATSGSCCCASLICHYFIQCTSTSLCRLPVML